MLSPAVSPKRTPSPTTQHPSPSPPPILPPLQSIKEEPRPNSITLIETRPTVPSLTSVIPYGYSPSPFYVEHHHWYHQPPPHHQPPHLNPAVFSGPRPPLPLHIPDLNYMPHRIETSDRMSRRTDDRNHYDQPSPPPIATLPHHSPAPSGGSSISSPSPPLQQPQQPYYAQQVAPMHPGQAYPYPPPGMNGGYPNDDRHQGYPPASHVPPGLALSTRAIRPAYVPTQTYPGQANYVIHTDDAATKLSDRVRRKCYNCRTTDTSTWRRSSLTPGKVLCNKCGLFERTHSRPRPEQFPHKRGPVVTSTFKSTRTTPPASSGGRLPPMNSQLPHQLPPHHYDHPSIAPLMSSRGESQNSYSPNGSHPDVRNLLNGPSSPGSQQQQMQQEAQQGASSAQSVPQKRSASPLPRMSPTQSPRAEQRSPPYVYRSVS